MLSLLLPAGDIPDHGEGPHHVSVFPAEVQLGQHGVWSIRGLVRPPQPHVAIRHPPLHDKQDEDARHDHR